MIVLLPRDLIGKVSRETYGRYKSLFETAAMTQRNFGIAASKGEKYLAEHLALSKKLTTELKAMSDRLSGVAR